MLPQSISDKERELVSLSRRAKFLLLTSAGAVLTIVGVATGVAIWGTDSEPPPSNSKPFAGWVPDPPQTLRDYADCLKSQNVAVDRLVGMYVLVQRANPASIAASNKSCAEQRKSHQKTITVSNFEIPDQAGYRFVSSVRQCLFGRFKDIPAEDEPIFLVNGDDRREKAFNACVEEIRARPTPTA